MSLVQVGDPAPDVTVLDTRGQEVALSVFWRERPAVLVFLRHFG
jgi:peroxiredoxin